MNDQKLHIVAKFTAKPGMEDVVKQELVSLIGPTRGEAGCISYDCHQSQENPSIFVFYEVWKNREELNKHLEMPYLQALLGKVEELFALPPELHFMNKLD